MTVVNPPNMPLVDGSGRVTPPWYRFFSQLTAGVFPTGGGGGSTPTSPSEDAAEVQGGSAANVARALGAERNDALGVPPVPVPAAPEVPPAPPAPPAVANEDTSLPAPPAASTAPEVPPAPPAPPAVANEDTSLLGIPYLAQFLGGLPKNGRTVRSATANTTLLPVDDILLVDATSGAVTVTLPALAASAGKVYAVKKIDAGGNAVTVDGDGAETIDGATTVPLASVYDGVSIVAGPSEWSII